jgi:hypothetical protein
MAKTLRLMLNLVLVGVMIGRTYSELERYFFRIRNRDA